MKLRAQRLLLLLIQAIGSAWTWLASPDRLFLAATGVVAYGVSFWSVGAALVTGGALLIIDLRT